MCGPDGTLRGTVFLGGKMVEVVPHEDMHSWPLGFYDADGNPVPDPI